MPEIKPFKAVRYNKDSVKNIAQVIAPPYDIIPEKLQDELYARSPNNFVRLELNKITPSDSDIDNQYTRSRDLFTAWLNQGVLTRDSKEAVYIYAQKYKIGKKQIEQIGFIGLMGLDSDGRNKVLPHENTLATPKEDRLKLTRLIRANLSPIFVLFEDKKHVVTSILKEFMAGNKAVIDTTYEGVKHRVWKLDDRTILNKITLVMGGKDIFIADGHHRYEVSRMYNKENSGVKHIMVYFVEMDERMLTVLPTHRVVKDAHGMSVEEITGKLKKYFSIEKVKGLQGLLKKLTSLIRHHAFGMYLAGCGFYILKLKNEKESDRAIKDKPKVWKRLDVSILHQFIFKNVLDIDDSDDNIEFFKVARDAVTTVDGGKFAMAFFLNPAKVSEVKKIAKIGERMPRKATYFYPKQLSGLVVNKF